MATHSISPGRSEQISALIEDLGLVPVNLITPTLVDLIHLELLEKHHTEVISSLQAEETKLYLEKVVSRRRKRIRLLTDDLDFIQLKINFD